MRDYKTAVYIGRFQPFHNGHLEVVKHGLEIADKVVIVVGSANAAPNIKNPWSFVERERMIRAGIADYAKTAARYQEEARVNIVGVRDYYYNENTWVTEVQSKTDPFIEEGDSVALIGSYKDGSSYYLNFFPQWDFIPVKTDSLDATTIRKWYFEHQTKLRDWEGKIPELRRTVAPFIKDNVPGGVATELEGFTHTQRYANICAEWSFIEDYKKSWEAAPYPPTFVCTDAIVVCSGHVLVVKRKLNPGKGLYALPGGFLKQNEQLAAGALRELREETGIRVDKLILQAQIADTKVFDHPDRSLRGRTITHGFYVKLKDGRLPEVKGGDDASEAFWLPLMDVAKLETEFYEDHAHIINYFIHS